MTLLGIRDKWSKRIALAAAAALGLSMLVLLTTSAPGHAATPRTFVAAARTGHVSAGHVVHAATSTTPFMPTAAQQTARTRDMKFLDSLPKAPLGPHTMRATARPPTGPQTTLTGARAPTDFKIYQDSAAPNVCATDCAESVINEPDTANAGRFIMRTSNWDMAYSTDGGDAAPKWSYQDPYSLSSGFCCDQTITSIQSRNRFVYEGLTLGSGTQTGFTIALTATWAPTSWCTYHFDGSLLGGTAGDVLDYPKIAYDNNFVDVTWNEYNSTGASWLFTGLVRLPIDAMASCSGINYNFLTRNDNFTYGLTYGNSSLDTFYWVSDWYTTQAGSGTSERIFSWPDNSGSYSFTDIGVTAFNFAGGNCASQDGVVTNWCGRDDPRWETAWISRAEYNAQANSAFNGDTILGVAITAGPAGSDPFPYVIYEYFKLNQLSFIQTSATFNNGFAIAFAGCAPDVYGYVGCTMSWGGGTGTSHFFPGGLILVQDNVAPTQPWSFSFNLSGGGNASDWGDYMVTQPWEPDVGPFITTEWVVSGGKVVDHEVVFGRSRDSNGWFRYKKS
jgi:hypothetical protein